MGNSNVGSYGSMGYNMNTSKQSGWNETTWYCNHCGTPNSSDATRCAGCGTLRPNSGKPSLASAAAQMGNSRETQTGWYCSGPEGPWYYFDNSGAMLKNTTTPDGYHLDGNGEWK